MTLAIRPTESDGRQRSLIPMLYRLNPAERRSPYPMLHIDVPTLEEFKALALARDEASVSIYVPTSPVPADAKANRIAFKNLAKQALAQIGELGIVNRPGFTGG